MAPRFSKDALKQRRRTALRPAPRTTEPAMGLDEALETLRTAPAAVRQIITQHRAAVAEHPRQVNDDPNLSEQGRANRLAELRAQAGAPAAQASAQLRAAIEQAQAAITARAERAKPQPAAGLEALMSRQIRWTRVREQLDGGVPLDEVIAEADTETLHAMAEELPAFLRISGFNPDSRAQIGRALDDQLAIVAGGRVLETHQAAREAEEHVARAMPLLGYTDALGAGSAGVEPEGNLLAAAFASSLAAEQAAGRLDPAEAGEAPEAQPMAGETPEARPVDRPHGLAAAFGAGGAP